MAGYQDAKAISLVVSGQITERADARVFEVPSSDGQRTYTIAVLPRSMALPVCVCNCQAGAHGRDCYHATAVRLLLAQERETVSA